MRLSALDCLRRGFRNLSANWELVLLQWLQSLLVPALLFLGIAAPVAILAGPGAFGRKGPVLGRAFSRIAEDPPILLLSLVAALALWLLAYVVYCYFQAGTYGVLWTADRQALPGPPKSPLLFRTFSVRDFFGWGGRYVGRYLRFFLFACLLAALAFGGIVLWIASIAEGGQAWGAGAALGIGCGGIFPLGFLALVFSFWFSVAQADLAREGSSVGAASRLGLSVLGRRLGAVLFLFFVFLLVAAALAFAFFLISIVVDLLLSGAPAMRAVTQLLLLFAQGIPNALLAVALGAALVALVRSETQMPMRKRPEVQTA
ncbi:MAG TPA: hypothetical protein VJ725_06480 [Thermoanaerobaculia bacterium]|nr:hypothetical protein [Thermoanaerobaculia bacterium]